VVNALNKGINNPKDKKGHIEEGKDNITVFAHEYYSKYILDSIINKKGKQVRLSGYTVCDTTLYTSYFKSKYE